ncbi:12251_t:CDS:2, partial [Acaulospora morrowiae]
SIITSRMTSIEEKAQNGQILSVTDIKEEIIKKKVVAVSKEESATEKQTSTVKETSIEKKKSPRNKVLPTTDSQQQFLSIPNDGKEVVRTPCLKEFIIH